MECVKRHKMHLSKYSNVTCLLIQVVFVNSMNMSQTPIKILHPFNCCFICKKKNLDPKAKTKIFGRSQMDFPQLISRSTQIDFTDYEDCSELSICALCYKLMVRYKNALEKLYKLESEINKTTHVCVKRTGKEIENEKPPVKKLLTFGDDNLGAHIPIVRRQSPKM